MVADRTVERRYGEQNPAYEPAHPPPGSGSECAAKERHMDAPQSTIFVIAIVIVAAIAVTISRRG